jgi:hypothetical protein
MVDAKRRMSALRHPTKHDVDQGSLVQFTTPRILMSAPNDALLHDASGGHSA